MWRACGKQAHLGTIQPWRSHLGTAVLAFVLVKYKENPYITDTCSPLYTQLLTRVQHKLLTLTIHYLSTTVVHSNATVQMKQPTQQCHYLQQNYKKLICKNYIIVSHKPGPVIIYTKCSTTVN